MEKYLFIFSFFITNVLIGGGEEYITKIQSLIGMGSYDKANEIFISALQEYDANASLYFIGGEISIKLDNLDEANKYLIKAIELDSKNEEYRDVQIGLKDLKNLLTNAKKTLDNGNIDNAIYEYEQIAMTYSESALVIYKLGRAFRRNKDYDNAVANYKKAIELNPFEEKYMNSIKVISNDMIKSGDADYRIKEFDTAMNYYNKSIHYAPKYAPTYFKVANVYLKLRDIDKAIESLEIGLSYDSSYAKIHLMLGKLYKKRNKME